MGILFNEVERKDLRAGDHIYSWRTGYTYAHHGIFVGDDDVVHFNRGSVQEIGAGVSLINSFASSSIPKQHLSCPRSPHSCGLQYGNSGVIRSCLDCFLDGGAVHRFEYGVSKAVFFAQVRGGTCTLAQSDPPDEVIHRTMYLHKHGFGNYDLFCNNCEDFAIYCRTGYIVKRRGSGGSGQAASMDGVCSAFSLVYDNRYMLNHPLCLALALVVSYSYKRYAADIGVRVDKTKVPVEDLPVNLDSSARNNFDKAKVPVEDSSVYPASSTDSSVDKAKVRVEDVAIFLDSFTGKKLPLEDLAVSPNSSIGISVDKSKVPIENSAVNLESAGIRVDKMKAPVGSSTGKKPPAEDLAAYFDSSTAIFVDKSKVPVEAEALFLDSSTVKKPSADESSTSQAINRKRSSKKQKKKLRQQQRRNCELMQEVEDVAQFPDSSTGKKLPVEDVAVSLVSSTAEKPPVAENSSSPAISRNRSSRKQKKKLRQQQRRNCQPVECPNGSGPCILQGN